MSADLVDRLRLGGVHECAVLCAGAAQQAGQPPGVDAGDADEAAPLEPAFEVLHRAPVGWLGDVGAQHEPERRRGARLQVVLVGPHIANMGKCEGDDLPGVGGIGQDLLVAAHRGVEADLAHGLAHGAKAAAAKDRSVGERERRCGGRRSSPGHRISCGPAACPRRPVRVKGGRSVVRAMPGSSIDPACPPAPLRGPNSVAGRPRLETRFLSSTNLC